MTATSADDKTKLADGVLLTIDNSIDPTTGTIKVKATFPNIENKLWPGQFINARLKVDERQNALTVPSAAVQRGVNGLFVYVVKADQTVAATPIDVSQDTGTISVVDKGVDGRRDRCGGGPVSASQWVSRQPAACYAWKLDQVA